MPYRLTSILTFWGLDGLIGWNLKNINTQWFKDCKISWCHFFVYSVLLYVTCQSLIIGSSVEALKAKIGWIDVFNKSDLGLRRCESSNSDNVIADYHKKSNGCFLPLRPLLPPPSQAPLDVIEGAPIPSTITLLEVVWHTLVIVFIQEKMNTIFSSYYLCSGEISISSNY